MNQTRLSLRLLTAAAFAAVFTAALMAGGLQDAPAPLRGALPSAGLRRSEDQLKRAMRRGRGSEAGSEAALELAQLDYTAGRFNAALAALRRARTWTRDEGIQPAWLYWSGQTRLALKQWGPAGTDFHRLLDGWPGDGNADAARLGEADALAAGRNFGPAAVLYQGLVDSKSPFSAQALWGLAALAQDQGRSAEANAEFRRLLQDYPASFEAQAVPGGPARESAPGGARAPASSAMPGSGPAGSPAPAVASGIGAEGPAALSSGAGPWSVQVGAFSRIRWARQLVLQLKRRRYRVQVLRREILGRRLYLVQVGPYPDEARASSEARLLSSRDKLPFKLVQE